MDTMQPRHLPDVMRRLFENGQKIGLTEEDWSEFADTETGLWELLVLARSSLVHIKLGEYLVDLEKTPRKRPGLCAEEAIPQKRFSIIEKIGDDLYVDRRKVELVPFPGELQKMDEKGSIREGDLPIEDTLPVEFIEHLLKNNSLLPEHWRKDSQGRARCIFFSRTRYFSIFPAGTKGLMCLVFVNAGFWFWAFRHFEEDWRDTKESSSFIVRLGPTIGDEIEKELSSGSGTVDFR